MTFLEPLNSRILLLYKIEGRIQYREIHRFQDSIISALTFFTGFRGHMNSLQGWNVISLF